MRPAQLLRSEASTDARSPDRNVDAAQNVSSGKGRTATIARQTAVRSRALLLHLGFPVKDGRDWHECHDTGRRYIRDAVSWNIALRSLAEKSFVNFLN